MLFLDVHTRDFPACSFGLRAKSSRLGLYPCPLRTASVGTCPWVFLSEVAWNTGVLMLTFLSGSEDKSIFLLASKA